MLIFSCDTNNQNSKVTSVIPSKSELGEGAVWDYKYKRLLWVDINGKKLNVFSPHDNLNQIFEMPAKIGTVVPYKANEVVVALQTGIYIFNLNTEELIFKTNPEEDINTNRFNDGKCDPAGRFWVGSMNTVSQEKTGGLYRIDSDFNAQLMVSQVKTSNGIVWSIDKTKMYYIDTPTRLVREYNYDNKTGHISYNRDAITIPDSLGWPDGSTLDSEGHLWIAMWGGACVTRWNVNTGELIDKIKVPAKNVTSCAFGGEDYNQLFITTAKVGMNEEEASQYPEAGNLFSITTRYKGIKASYFAEGVK